MGHKEGRRKKDLFKEERSVCGVCLVRKGWSLRSSRGCCKKPQAWEPHRHHTHTHTHTHTPTCIQGVAKLQDTSTFCFQYLLESQSWSMVFLKGKSNHVILCFTSINHLHAPHNKIPALKRGLTRPHMSGLYPPVLHPQNTAPQSGDDVSYLHISASCHSFCSKHVSLNVWKLVFSRSSYRISFLEKSLQDPWRDHHSTHSQIK